MVQKKEKQAKSKKAKGEKAKKQKSKKRKRDVKKRKGGSNELTELKLKVMMMPELNYNKIYKA